MSVGIEHVAHAGHRADGRAALVDGVVGDVGVAVDQARRDESSRDVDDLGVGRDGDVRADRGDLAVAKDDGAVGDRPLRDRQDGAAAQRDDADSHERPAR